LVEANLSFSILGKRAEGGFSGTVGPPGGKLPVSAVLIRNKLLVLQVGSPDRHETISFKREALTANGNAPAAPPADKRHVIINGLQLSDAELARVEKAYKVRINDADYWYDRILGAWGLHGGPTVGFVLPGLELGGPLPADASAGSTKVFINDRELPLADLLALQRVTGPVLPGRYFITAQGLAGFEGGPPLWNLAALAAAKSDNPSNNWSSKLTGASGFSDGTTTAIFFSDGTSVSTGR
jgi:hypothetical protein